MNNPIKLNYLDHVAIRVTDLELSAKWYEEVLGLKKYKVEKWGGFPIFMLSGKTGVALFPNNPDEKSLTLKSAIDHFAFNVDKENFDKAIKKYKTLGLKFRIEDHYYFDSVYTTDPDGHIVELTMIKVDEKDFYEAV